MLLSKAYITSNSATPAGSERLNFSQPCMFAGDSNRQNLDAKGDSPSGKPLKPRYYQEEAVSKLRNAIAAGSKRPLLVMPTGSGKSLVYAEIVKLALEKGGKILFLVHRRNLVTQMKATLERHGIDNVGVIMSGHESATGYPVQVGTIQTYHRRLQLEELTLNRFFIQATVVLVDEAHRVAGKNTYGNVLKLHKDAIVVGCTATPMRGDGRGTGEVFDTIIDVIGVQELTDKGFISPARYFVPSTPDLAKIKVVRGDYQESELEKTMNTPKLVGDVVENWLRIAEGRKTIVFCVTVRHSQAVVAEFQKQGIAAFHLDANSSDEQRDYAFNEMNAGRISVISNVGLYVEGTDVPDISCVVLARPTKSLGLYRQACGRGLRPAPGKDCCIVIDHGGVIEEHGLLTDEIEWTLDGKEKAWRKKKSAEKKEVKPVQCSACALVFTGANKCPDCGSPIKSFGKVVATAEGELQELKPKKASKQEKQKFYGMLVWICRAKGYSSGWASHKYKEKFGVWPKGLDPIAIQPDDATWNYIKHLQIKYAKGRKCGSTR